jgi:hypothetical protein
MKVLKGKFAIPGRPMQIREFPLARRIAGTQPGPGALSCAQRQIATNILIGTDSNAGDVELTKFGRRAVGLENNNVRNFKDLQER